MTLMKRLAATVGLIALGAGGLVALGTTTALANTGSVTGGNTCSGFDVSVQGNNNIATADLIVVTTTIPGTTGIGTLSPPTGDAGNSSYGPIVDYSGPAQSTGTVTLYILEPNGSGGYTTVGGPDAEGYHVTLAPVEGCAPTTTTTTTVASAGGVQGTSVTDTVTVAPGTGSGVPTGTVTFDLYGPSCTGDPVFGPDTETLSGGTATSAPPYTPTATGTYYWTASYTPASGSGFAASSSGCGAANESVTITAPTTTPGPTTTTTVASAGGVQGTSVTDTVTVAPGTGSGVPTGTVTFSLYGPSKTAVCSATDLAFGPDSQALSGGTATSASFTPSTSGTYYWTASYTPTSGSGFAASSSPCGAAGESVAITASGTGAASTTATPTPTPVGAAKAASTLTTPTTGADLFLPGLSTAFAFLFGGLLLMAGVRLRRRPIV